MSVDRPKNPERRQAVVAAIAGATIAAALAVPSLAYGIQYVGAEALLLAALIAPAVSGFIVGLLVRANGAALAVVSCVPPIMAALLKYLPRGLDDIDPAANPGILPYLAMAALISAIFGGLGCSAAHMPRRLRILMTAVVIASFPLVAGTCGLRSKREIASFRTGVLRVVEQRFGDQVMRLDPGTTWSLRRLRVTFGRTHVVQASTTVRGHQLAVVTSTKGERVSRCRYSYEPSVTPRLTDEDSMRRYLKDLGVSPRMVQKLKFRHTPHLSARAWFCGNALLPNPARPPCTDRPHCDGDFVFEATSDGVVRIRRTFFAAGGRF